MAEFIVAIDQITYYTVEAEDEIMAIDRALAGDGQELAADTRDAYISDAYTSHDAHRSDQR
jgi:hypothetical protein